MEEQRDDGAGGTLQSRAGVEGLFALTRDLLAVMDLSTVILEASQSWQRMLGWPLDEVIGVRLLDLMHPDDLPRAEAELASILVGGSAEAVDVRLRQHDGGYRWVQGSAIAELAQERIYASATDITERKRLESELQRRVDMEDAVASVAAGLIAADPLEIETAIERGVGTIGEQMGADRAYFLRASYRDDSPTFVEWMAPGAERPDTEALELPPELIDWWGQVLRGGVPVHVPDLEAAMDEAGAPEVYPLFREQGIRSFLIVPLPEHRRWRGFIGLVTVHELRDFSADVTTLLGVAGECFMSALEQVDSAAALRDAQRELEQRNAELERSNEELERFAHSAAHDLRAPLARVQMALSAGANDELLAIARRGASRMSQLIDDLLTFASVGSGTAPPARVELDDVLTEVLADLASVIAARSARVERSPLPSVWGHRSLVGQLIQNLVSNALKFSRDDGSAVIAVSGHADERGTELRVEDNGIGIPPDQRTNVFSMFTRLSSDDQASGSGIGLATCAKVMAHHGGTIRAEDGIDGGTAIVAWFPSEHTAPG